MSVPSQRETTAIFLLVLAGGLVLTLAGVVRGSPPAPAVASIADRLLDGSATEEADAALERNHPLRQGAIAVLAATRYLVFRDATGAAVVGRDGWLYTLEEFERRERDAELLASRLGEISRVEAELAARGVSLAVLLLPSKARVHPGPLGERWRRLAEHPRYDEARRVLREAGTVSPDLSGVLGPESFFERDTHWTPAGAAAAARTLAAAVDEAALLAGVSRTRYDRVPAGFADVPGDLMSFVPVGPLRERLGLAVEEARQYELSAPESDVGLGLFDDLTIPVVLVGTSFSRDERWGFEGSLKAALRADVLNVAAEGAGPFEPMRELLAGDAIEDVSPRLVIWEIPERYLTLESQGSE